MVVVVAEFRVKAIDVKLPLEHLSIHLVPSPSYARCMHVHSGTYTRR